MYMNLLAKVVKIALALNALGAGVVYWIASSYGFDYDTWTSFTVLLVAMMVGIWASAIAFFISAREIKDILARLAYALLVALFGLTLAAATFSIAHNSALASIVSAASVVEAVAVVLVSAVIFIHCSYDIHVRLDAENCQRRTEEGVARIIRENRVF